MRIGRRMPKARVLHAPKIGSNYRISLTKDVVEKLGAAVGDIILIVDDGRGNIVLKKAE